MSHPEGVRAQTTALCATEYRVAVDRVGREWQVTFHLLSCRLVRRLVRFARRFGQRTLDLFLAVRVLWDARRVTVVQGVEEAEYADRADRVLPPVGIEVAEEPRRTNAPPNGLGARLTAA